MIAEVERAIERGVWVLERLLALAFLAAVGLSFVNVVGRYGFGRSILWADEVQVYIMVWMTFLGAAVVSWRRMHLRMDALTGLFPRPMQTALAAVELALLVALSGFVLVQSWGYVGQMIALDRKSDVGAIPMWIPHAAVAAGFGLMALMGVWRGVVWLRGAHRGAHAEVREREA